MRSVLAIIAVALLGLFAATSIGYAAYLVSRDSVGSPVTRLKLSPNRLAPAPAKRKAAKPRPRTTPTVPTAPRTTTTDDHGGRSGNSGKGSDDSGRGSDDD